MGLSWYFTYIIAVETSLSVVSMASSRGTGVNRCLITESSTTLMLLRKTYYKLQAGDELRNA
jgi:hypothetical protein